MKYYNTKIIRDYIENNKDFIEVVTCGMREDWGWTAERIFKDGHYILDLSGKTVNLAGIEGSTWATPVMEVDFKDGRTEIISCYQDDGINEDDSRLLEQKIYAFKTGGMDYKL